MKKKKLRKCPKCGKRFKPMTDKQFRVALVNHFLFLHGWQLEEANNYVDGFLSK